MRRLSWLPVLCALACPGALLGAERQEIAVGVYDNAPLVFVDARGKPAGLFVELLEQIAQAEGWRLRYVSGSWADVYGRLERDEIDLLAAIAFTEARDRQFHLSRETVLSNWGVILQRAGGPIASLLDLADRRVALLDRDVHTAALTTLLQRFDIPFTAVPVQSYGEVIERVESGAVEAGVLNRLYAIQHTPGRDVAVSGIVFNPVELRFAAPRARGRALVDAVDRHLVALKADPGSAFHGMLERWVLGRARAAFPEWVGWALAGAALLSLVMLGLWAGLRAEVRSRTAEVVAKSRDLEAEIARRKLSEERLRRLLDASPDLIFLVAGDGRFLDVMTSETGLLYRPREEFLGRTVAEVLPEALGLRFLDGVRAALATGEVQTIEYPLEVPEGARWFEARIAQARGVLDGERAVLVSVRDISDRQRALEALRASEDRFRTLAGVAPVGILIADAAGHCQYVNERWSAFTGLGLEQALGEGWTHAVHPEDFTPVVAAWEQAVAGVEALSLEYRFLRSDGTTVWVTMRSVPVRDAEGRVQTFIGSVTDVTEMKAAEQRLRQSAVFFESTTEGLVVTDDRARISAVNQAFTAITGFTDVEVLGCRPRMLRSAHHDKAFYRAMRRTILRKGRWEGELWIKTRSGESAPQWLTVSAVKDRNGRVINYVAAFSDIRALKESEARLARLAHHDPLTDLPNRLLLNEHLHRSMRAADRAGYELAVLFLDLDRFKNINDSLGHPAGDQVLRVIAERLRASVRDIDTVARLGGDEFVVVMEQVRDRADVERLSVKLTECIHGVLRVASHDLYLSTSIGISVYPSDGADVATLVRNADAAMYEAKAAGRNTHRFYTRELTDGALRRVVLETSLRAALEREELILHYQPQVSLASGALVGAEALVRWRHPQEGLLPPVRFLGLAEECGLMGLVGEWVLRTACRQVSAWGAAGLAVGTVAVNLSAYEIGREDLVDFVAAVLSETGCPPERLELELTEGSIMRRAEETIRTLEGLRALGVSLAVDDFGTGYSSLSYLKRFPIRTLKIDRSFVRDIPADPNDEAIAAAILALARSLDLRVVAEGVETEAQRAFLLGEGCEVGQGYLFGRPMEAPEFERLAQARRGGDTAARAAG